MKAVSRISGFVGHAGQSVYLSEGQEFDSGDQIVKDLPQHFRLEEEPDEPSAPKRRVGGRG